MIRLFFLLINMLFILCPINAYSQLTDDIVINRMLTELDKLPNDTNRVKQLNLIGWQYLISDRSSSAKPYIMDALTKARELNYLKGEAQALNYIGVFHQTQSNYALAFDYYLRCLEKFKESGDKKGIAFANQSLGVIYYIQENFDDAVNYYEKAISIYEQIDDNRGIAQNISNIAACYLENGDLEKSLKNYQRSFDIYSKINSIGGKCIQLISIGDTYRVMKKYDLSLKNYELALNMAEEAGRKRNIVSALIGLGTTKIRIGNYESARIDLVTALALSKDLESLNSFSNIYKHLSTLDSIDGNWNSAYVNHLKHISYRDSLSNNESSKETIKAQMKYAFDKQEAINQVEQEKKDIRQKFVRNIIGGGLIGSLIFGFVVFRQRNKTAKEKQRSDALLLNILPAEIAEELKEKGEAEARNYNMVSILFTDFIQFTRTSEKLTAKELVAEINECFRAFDLLMDQHNIEKIKTIGDAYMAAGGLPVPSRSAVKHTVLAAIEMQDFISKRKVERDNAGLPSFEMRVGIHTGPVVAGIVGLKKFQYDIWGDAVNTASRLESKGSRNKVNISKKTYDHICNDPELTFEYRGKIEAKGKGEIEMWFVDKNHLN